MFTKTVKLSQRMTPKLSALEFQRKYEARAAPPEPMSPKPKIGIRSPGRRIDSASIAAIADSATMTIGMMAAKALIALLPR